MNLTSDLQNNIIISYFCLFSLSPLANFASDSPGQRGQVSRGSVGDAAVRDEPGSGVVDAKRVSHQQVRAFRQQ